MHPGSVFRGSHDHHRTANEAFAQLIEKHFLLRNQISCLLHFSFISRRRRKIEFRQVEFCRFSFGYCFFTGDCFSVVERELCNDRGQRRGRRDIIGSTRVSHLQYEIIKRTGNCSFSFVVFLGIGRCSAPAYIIEHNFYLFFPSYTFLVVQSKTIFSPSARKTLFFTPKNTFFVFFLFSFPFDFFALPSLFAIHSTSRPIVNIVCRIKWTLKQHNFFL